MKKIYVYGGLAVVLLIVLGYVFLGGSRRVEQLQTGQVQRIVKVTRGDLNLSVSANGVVQPINKVEIRSKAGGQILELNFEEGSYVQKKDLLAIVDTTQTKNDYDQAKADLASSTQALTQAENNARRSRELFEKKLISDQEFDQSKVDLVRAQTSLVRAKAALSTQEDRLRDTHVLAPITGVILSRSVDLGQIISSAVSNVGGGTVLASIANMEEVYVITNVDEVDIGKVTVGQRARVIADAFPDDSFYGEVLRIAPLGKTSQNVTTFNVIVLVKNLGGKLKAGMSASVDIEIFRRQNVLLVPNEALKDPKTEQGMALMASIKTDSTKIQPAGEGKNVAQANPKQEQEMTIEEIRAKMQTASGDERDKLRAQLRDKFQKMSSEDRQKMFSQFGRGGQTGAGGQGGGGGFGGGGMMMGGGGGMIVMGGPGMGDQGQRQRRQSQVSNVNEVKERIIVVKDSGQFVPRIVKVGPSNFDYAEIIEGLNAGDEIQVTTISRAKVAAEQMNERMRSNNGLSGMSGGGANRGR
jgi:HlyD family secretion protein